MANRITTLRLLLLFALVVLVYELPAAWQLVNAPLLVLIFVLDGVDGYVARRWREVTTFGALYDIAVDRVIENALWIVFTHLGYVSVWVPIVFVTRGFVVDVIRSHAGRRGQTPFSMMRTALGRWLVASRFMRAAYAAVKAAAFAWILVLRPVPELMPATWSAWSGLLDGVTQALVWLATGLCLVRGVPVVVDFLAAEHGRLRAAKRPAAVLAGRSAPAGEVRADAPAAAWRSAAVRDAGSGATDATVRKRAWPSAAAE